MTRTRTLQVHPVGHDGAEDVVVATSGRHEGSVYTGTVDGAVLRVSHDGSRVEQVGSTGGRPLGIEVDPDGRLLVCDSHRGVLRMDPDTGAVEQVLAAVDGVPMVFCNNAAIASDGTVWFSDSSRHFGIDRWKDDFVQDTASGRLLALRPDGSVETVLDGLRFANGVALAPDESFVVVAETRGRTLVRHWLTGDRAGTRDLLVDGLPGYPDNIARGSDGLIWVSIASPTDPVVERLGRAPLFVRKGVTKIPERFQPAPKRTCRVQAYDVAGTLVHDLDLDTPDFRMATGVREHEGRVWIGSLHEPSVGVVDL